ncbi:unnamed protein product [Peronospora belbahrii]|uniref:Uncharacterized protein n=1 Tax=Peronospora belbahrii TaxID=622444 RepID=A0ABN8CYR9_9STRA|nr:unnamed protein product [Peronospora belbahrii]
MRSRMQVNKAYAAKERSVARAPSTRSDNLDQAVFQTECESGYTSSSIVLTSGVSGFDLKRENLNPMDDVHLSLTRTWRPSHVQTQGLSDRQTTVLLLQISAKCLARFFVTKQRELLFLSTDQSTNHTT